MLPALPMATALPRGRGAGEIGPPLRPGFSRRVSAPNRRSSTELRALQRSPSLAAPVLLPRPVSRALFSSPLLCAPIPPAPHARNPPKFKNQSRGEARRTDLCLPLGPALEMPALRLLPSTIGLPFFQRWCGGEPGILAAACCMLFTPSSPGWKTHGWGGAVLLNKPADGLWTVGSSSQSRARPPHPAQRLPSATRRREPAATLHRHRAPQHKAPSASDTSSGASPRPCPGESWEA